MGQSIAADIVNSEVSKYNNMNIIFYATIIIRI